VSDGTDRSGDVGGAEEQRAARRDEAVRAAVEQGLLGPDTPIVGLLDVAGIRESAAALRAAFDAVTAPGTPVLHAFAVKATPLVPVLRLLHEEGVGAEVASPGELALARASCGRRWRWASRSTRTTRRSWRASTP
jgi:diaminopimelate decarboxylase